MLLPFFYLPLPGGRRLAQSASMAEHINRLAHETSPYLLQHAHNPVDWHPWNPEALELARRSDKPILLSIGYSACHWCHVMAHESFEDSGTAAVMNELFINIKVDREERPDLDRIYQTAHQLLNQRAGGWPLTIILTPDNLIPFFSGTYFPKEPRYGLPGFVDLLRRIAAFYREQRETLHQHEQQVRAVFAQIEANADAADVTPGRELLTAARDQLAKEFDAQHGGFGVAPKFPHPSQIERLLRHAALSEGRGVADAESLRMAVFTLERMARGGLYDQLGGGFYRYSVDAEWRIPHFEKMLYDNGPLLSLYANAWRLTQNELFRDVALATGEFLLRELRAPEGGFYSSLDADSEGHEGKYYVWSPDEIDALLDRDLALTARAAFGVEGEPNFEGSWHLQFPRTGAELADRLNIPADAVRERVQLARGALLAARQRRIAPGRDNKRLTAWNALAVRGLAETGRLLQQAHFVTAALECVDFLRNHLWRDGRLLASYSDGEARLPAYLDDYAFLLDALLASLQARWRDEDLRFACAIADALLTHFEDTSSGGFFFTAHDHEKLIYRPKPFADEALPAGNAVAAFALNRLGHVTGNTRYIDAAKRVIDAAAARITEAPVAYCTLLSALEEILVPPQLIVLRGNPADLNAWQQEVATPAAPRRIVLAIAEGGMGLPGAQDARAADQTWAYRCDGFACSAPIYALQALLQELAANERRQ